MVRQGSTIARIAAMIALASAALAGGSPGGAEDSLAARDLVAAPIQERPYEVLMLVSFSDEPIHTTAFREASLRSFGEIAARLVGRLWRLEVRDATRSAPDRDAAALRTLRATDLAEHAVGRDKMFVAHIAEADGTFRITARELDAATSVLGAVFSAEVEDRPQVAKELFRICARMFSPVGKVVETAEDQSAVVRVQGSALAPENDDLALVVPGTPFRPVWRVLGRDGALRAARPVPWTYLVARQVEGGRVECTIESALRTPFALRTRERTELVAVAARQSGAPTVVQFVCGAEQTPVAGREVTFGAGKEERGASLGWTDEEGKILIPSELTGVTTIALRVGADATFRAPIVASLVEEVTLAVNVDPAAADRALLMEGRIVALQERVVDAIVLHNSLAARIEGYMREKNWSAAERLVGQLHSVTTLTGFRKQLDALGEQASAETLKGASSVTRRRIGKLLDETEGIVGRAPTAAAAYDVDQTVAKARSAGAEDSGTP